MQNIQPVTPHTKLPLKKKRKLNLKRYKPYSQKKLPVEQKIRQSLQLTILTQSSKNINY
jgi:hypothetical protein